MLGGAIGIAVVSSVWNADVRTHLSNDVGLSSTAIDQLLHEISLLVTYPADLQTAIRVACAHAYNAQMRYTIIFSGLSFFVAATLWRGKQLVLGDGGEVDHNKEPTRESMQELQERAGPGGGVEH
jgi:hypothetical protein